MADLIFTTNPGLERLAFEEFERRLRRAGLSGAALKIRPTGCDGQILCRTDNPLEAIRPVAEQMRAVHHVLQPLRLKALPKADPLAAIERAVRRLDIADLRRAARFRVTCKRSGDHPFSSMEVQRVIGAALVEDYGVGVDLKDYDVNVRVDVHDRHCLVGLQLTRTALSKRFKRPFQPRASLNPTVAYALLHLAQLEGGEGAVLDPFCGSGTVLMEAAQLYPHLEICGSDWIESVVEGARRNADLAGVSGRIDLACVDARALSAHYAAGRFGAIVSNPPYGVRLGQRTNFYWLYRRFLEQALKVLAPGGRVVVLVWKRRIFDRVLGGLKAFRTVRKLAVETGQIWPRIFVLERR